MKSIVVTTSVKTNNELNEKAHNIAKFLNFNYEIGRASCRERV